MVSKIFRNKSGAIFFTLDTLIAGLIILVTLILVLSIHGSSPVVEDTYHDLANYMRFLTTTTMEDVRNNYPGLYNNPFEKDLDLYIYQKAFKLVVEGNRDEARNMIGNLSHLYISEHMGFEYVIDDIIIYSYNNATRDIAKTSITNRVLTFVVVDDSLHSSITNITFHNLEI